MSTHQTAIAQRSGNKIHFAHKDMDYYLGWIMGRAIYDGSRAAECLAVAARIREGDAQSWREEGQALAQQVETTAVIAAASLSTTQNRSGMQTAKLELPAADVGALTHRFGTFGYARAAQ